MVGLLVVLAVGPYPVSIVMGGSSAAGRIASWRENESCPVSGRPEAPHDPAFIPPRPTTRMGRCNIPGSIMQEINWHSAGEGVDCGSYIAYATALEWQAALNALPKLGLVPYALGRFAHYLEQSAAEWEREASAREDS